MTMAKMESYVVNAMVVAASPSCFAELEVLLVQSRANDVLDRGKLRHPHHTHHIQTHLPTA